MNGRLNIHTPGEHECALMTDQKRIALPLWVNSLVSLRADIVVVSQLMARMLKS